MGGDRGRCPADGARGVFTEPTHLIHYTGNDEVCQEFTVIYRGQPVGGVPTISAESARVEWVSVDRIPGLTMDPSQRKRIDWAITNIEPHFDPE